MQSFYSENDKILVVIRSNIWRKVMKKLFKSSMNESQYHFSLRKISIGVCSVALGLFAVGINNSEIAKADKVEQPIQQQNIISKRSDTYDTQQAKLVNESKELENTTDKRIEKNVGQNKIVPSNQTLYESVNVQSKENVDLQNVTVESDQNNKGKVEQTQSKATNTLKSNDFEVKANKDIANSSVAYSTMLYSIPSTSNGWENHNGKMYYRDWDGNYLRNQWAAPTGTMHYFGREGYTINNQWYTLTDNNTYYFDQTGHTVKNRWYSISNSSTYYFDNFGHTVKNRWYTLPSSKTYYFDNTGHTVRNRWYSIPNSSTYYFDNFGHTVKNRWYTLPSSKTYYFDNTGHTVKNRWYTLSNRKTYYFDNYGHTVKNRWYNIAHGGTYYFDDLGHTVKSRWYTLGNIKYYFKENGKTAKNEVMNIEGTNYIFDANGNHEHKANIYYFDIDNAVLKIRSDAPNAYLTYKILNNDFMNNTLETTSFYGSVNEDLNKYVGINVEIQISQMGHIIDSKKFYIASQSPQLSNLEINNNVLTGHVSAGGDLYISNNGRKYYINTVETYGSDFSCDISFLNGTSDPNIKVEVDVNDTPVSTAYLSVPTTLQRANISDVGMDEYLLYGFVDRGATVKIISGSGETIESQDIPQTGRSFLFNLEEYAGQTVTLQLVQNGDVVYSKDYDVPEKHAVNSITLPEGYTLSALQEAQNDPSSFEAVAEKGREENKFTPESFADDQEEVDVSNLTSDQIEELSDFALRLINQAREQFRRSDWEYSDRVQKLANDVATEYVDNGKSGWEGHYVDGIVRAAQKNGLNITMNEIEDISSTYGYPSSTMTDLKKLVYNGITGFLFSDYNSPEYNHAADILSGHIDSYWNGQSENAEFAIAFTKVNDIVTVHFISVGSGKGW